MEGSEQGGGFGEGALAGGCVGAAPGRPVETEHLMEEACAVEREGKWG